MYLKRFYLGCLSHASYLIADEKSKIAVVVDPQRDVDQYLALARRKNWRIRHVLLTHFHADFVSGHLELQELCNATIHLGARAQADYAFKPMADGERLEFGEVALEFLETPGHTPEGVCILVYDLKKSLYKPLAVLTGDTLVIGDVGRPDLMAGLGVSARTLAGSLYDSLHRKLLTLPDETLIYPAHGAGSMCGKNLSSETVSTIADQKLHNSALKENNRSKFIRLVTADQPEAPAYFSYDAELNRRRRSTLSQSLRKALKALSPAVFLKRRQNGAICLDTRDPWDFARAHLQGSINIGLGGRFANWAGIILPRRHPIIVISNPGQETEALLRLGRIGFDHVAGYLRGGFPTLKNRQDLARIERVDAKSLRAELASQQPPIILDVRNDAERQAQSIPRSLHIPLTQLPRRLAEVPQTGRLIVHCASGYRSMIAASLLEKTGRKEIADLTGGLLAFKG